MKSIVIEIGPSAIFDDFNILIIFGEKAPLSLREFAIIHRFNQEPTTDLLTIGSRLVFGDQEYIVENIGSVANQTLRSLGHATLYFGLEPGTEVIPGAVVLFPYTMPKVSVGDTIQFIK